MNNYMSNIKIGNMDFTIKDKEARIFINNLQSQINGLANGSPLVASSIAGMTDTSKVYVNTTDGKWYYHNGTEWTAGGTYQATEIVDGSITSEKIENIGIEKVIVQSLKNDFSNVQPWNGAIVSGGYRNITINTIDSTQENAGVTIPYFEIDKTRDLYIGFKHNGLGTALYLYDGGTYKKALIDNYVLKYNNERICKVSKDDLVLCEYPRFVFATNQKEEILISDICISYYDFSHITNKELYPTLTGLLENNPIYSNVKEDTMQTEILEWKRKWGSGHYIEKQDSHNFKLKVKNTSSDTLYGFRSPFYSNLSKKLKIELDVTFPENRNMHIYLLPNEEDYTNYVGKVFEGHNEFVIDLPYYAVHKGFTEFAIALKIGNTTTDNTLVDIEVSNFKFYWSDITELEIYEDNLEGMIKKIDSTLSQKANKNEKTNETILLQGIDKKYILQAGNNKALQLIPVIPNKTLFIGNSLLIGNHHGEYAFGMCASNIESDYCYHVSQYILERNSNATFERMSGVAFEEATNESTVTTLLNDKLLPKLSEELELVIVQLGDNVNTAERLATFNSQASEFLKFIRTNSPNARVVWVGEWYSSTEKQNIIANACKNTGCQFVDISDLNIAENRGTIGQTITYPDGTITTVENSGVASHPGDTGFLAIANRIIENIFE